MTEYGSTPYVELAPKVHGCHTLEKKIAQTLTINVRCTLHSVPSTLDIDYLHTVG